VKLAARAVLSADASLLVSILDTCLSFEDNPTTLYAGSQMANFFPPVFPASRVQHISDMHSQFALRPHHVEVW